MPFACVCSHWFWDAFEKGAEGSVCLFVSCGRRLMVVMWVEMFCEFSLHFPPDVGCVVFTHVSFCRQVSRVQHGGCNEIFHVITEEIVEERIGVWCHCPVFKSVVQGAKCLSDV